MTTSAESPECDRLVERIPIELVERWSQAAVFGARLVIGGIVAMGVPLAIAVIWLPFRNQTGASQVTVVILVAAVACLFWGIIVFAVGSFVRAGWTRSNLPVVEICDGIVTVTWKSEVVKVRVDECHIRIGRAWQMKYAARKARRLFPFGDRDLILIDLPPLTHDSLGSVRSKTTVAVGYTDETRLRWAAALGIDDRE